MYRERLSAGIRRIAERADGDVNVTPFRSQDRPGTGGYAVFFRQPGVLPPARDAQYPPASHVLTRITGLGGMAPVWHQGFS